MMAKLTRREVLKGGAGLAGMAALGGCGGPGVDEIRVVGIFPLSGIAAADGKEMENGVRLAVEELNAAGGLAGKKLKLVVIDDRDSFTDQIADAFRRAVDVEKPDVIFSGYHIASGPEFDIVAGAGVPYYNQNTQEAWTDRYKKDPKKYGLIFQCDPNDTWYGGGFALWLDKLVKAGTYSPKAKTAALLSGDDPYDKTIADSFEKKIKELGWTLSGERQAFSAGKVSDWGPMLSRVRENPPAILFTTTFSPADNAAMAKQFAANPLPSLVYQQYGPSVPEYMNLAGDAANGILWATVLGLPTDAKGNEFRKKYQTRFGQRPGWANAGGCYDEVMVWAEAVKKAGDPRNYAKVAEETEKLTWRGVTGAISFVNHAGQQYPEQTSDVNKGQPHLIVQIQDRQHKVVSPAPFTDGEFKLPPWFKG